jgi:excinuclease ABC subunit C
MVSLAKSRLLDPETTRVVASRRARRAAANGGAGGDGEQATFTRELERSPERVFVAGRKDPIVLRQNSAELFLLMRLRDEAHRFAVTFHRKLRRSRNFQSVLEEIPGVGGGRRRALLRAFGSLRRIKEATAEELATAEGVGASAAQAVWEFFHPPAGVALALGDAGVEGPDGPVDASEAEIDEALAAEEPTVAPESSRSGAASGYPAVPDDGTPRLERRGGRT